jgi:hypothetical protein
MRFHPRRMAKGNVRDLLIEGDVDYAGKRI